MKFFILILGFLSFSALAEVPCPNAAMEKNQLNSLVRDFKKDCRRYPHTLLELIEKPKNCKKWAGGKDPYLKDDLESRALIERYKYTIKGRSFQIETLSCAE